VAGFCEECNEHFTAIKRGEFHDQLWQHKLLKEGHAPGSQSVSSLVN
jgi:hypothetical protein